MWGVFMWFGKGVVVRGREGGRRGGRLCEVADKIIASPAFSLTAIRAQHTRDAPPPCIDSGCILDHNTQLQIV